MKLTFKKLFYLTLALIMLLSAIPGPVYGYSPSDHIIDCDHSYVDGICTNCARPVPGDVQCDVISHSFRNGNCCLCGMACPHRFVAEGYGECYYCGMFKPETPADPTHYPHRTFSGAWIIKPDCTTSGQVSFGCSACSYTYLEAVAAPGHSYVSGKCEYCGEADPNYALLAGAMLLPCENVKVQLFVSGEDTPAYTAQISSETYYFTGVAPGEYTLKVSCDGGVPREYPVTLTLGKNTQNVTVSRPGDVDNDRSLTIADVSMTYAHVRGTVLLEGYSLQCANLNGDGQVDIVDTAIAYSMTKR